MLLKLMGVENLPDIAAAKSFTMLSNVDKVEKIVRNKEGVLQTDLRVVFSNPSKFTEEIFTLEGNAYLLNDAGKTIESIPANPGRSMMGNYMPQNPLGKGDVVWAPNGLQFPISAEQIQKAFNRPQYISQTALKMETVAKLRQHGLHTLNQLAALNDADFKSLATAFCPITEAMRVEIYAMMASYGFSYSEAKVLPPEDLKLGKLLSEVDDVDFLRKEVEYLWKIIDDIDTASDAAKNNDKAFRSIVEAQQGKRHLHITSDGYNLFMVKQ